MNKELATVCLAIGIALLSKSGVCVAGDPPKPSASPVSPPSVAAKPAENGALPAVLTGMRLVRTEVVQPCTQPPRMQILTWTGLGLPDRMEPVCACAAGVEPKAWRPGVDVLYRVATDQIITSGRIWVHEAAK